MMNLPARIATTRQLDALLSEPSPELVAALASGQHPLCEGDLLVLGASGKIGPSLARMARRAFDEAGLDHEVIAVARRPMPALEAVGVRTLSCDLADPEALGALPQAPNVVYMVGRKFGSTGSEWQTWAINTVVAAQVAAAFRHARLAMFSTGCVYPLVDVSTGGSVETDPPEPVGEYAMSCLGRERVFDYYSVAHGGRVIHIRLNYAVEMRYGVLYDVATRVRAGEPVDVTTGYANVLWQGDVCDRALRSLEMAASPPTILNLTGPETISIRWLAGRFGELFGIEPNIVGQENGRGYLSNATRANRWYGNPRVPLGTLIEWVASWVLGGGESLDLPTHYQIQDGRY